MDAEQHEGAAEPRAASSGLIGPLFDAPFSPSVVVIGDGMWDEWHEVRCERVSPEAACMIATPTSEERTPGGAGNALLCMAALNPRVINCTSLDLPGLPNPIGDEPVCVKRRLMSGNQQLMRVDMDQNLPEKLSRVLVMAACERADDERTTMLVADYGKNAVRIDDFNVFAERTWGAIVWDPYPANLQTLAAGKCWKLIPRGAFLKCNMKEARAAGFIKESHGSLDEVALCLEFTAPEHLNVVVTCGAAGAVARFLGDEIWQYPSYPTVPTNPIGAGDAFAAGLTHALSLGWSAQTAVAVGQYVAHVCVQMPRCGQPGLRDLAAYYDWLAHYVDNVEEAISGERIR